MAPQSMSEENSEASSWSGEASPRLAESDRNTKSQPIAVCGIGCKLPGDTTSDSKFWDLLVSCRSGQGKIPKSRFNIDGFYHPNGGERPGSLNTAGGYFIDENIRDFENSFFGINNMEAKYMDPQQRKLLEVVFESFESAGIPLEKVSGSNTGCYVGSFTIDHQVTQMKDPEYLSRYTATGIGTTILGNRISHAFNMAGPSLVLDTACSSSLYCMHMACVALENGECDAAIVAGANLVQTPEQHIGTMKAGVLSATSACHSFDSSADGYGRADGVSALYLKRLDDAIRDGDPIRSVVRGSAVNSNGKTPGITLPSANGQEAVIRKAYAKAGLPLFQTAYVECHGTGTKVGDVIEVEGISRVFKRPRYAPLLIGSVKSNLGHSEAASGISSVIKTTLALEHSAIPGTFGLQEINPKLKTKEWNIEIPTSLTPWPSDFSGNGSVRRASINSFGYGGANAHVILENADAHVPTKHTRQLQHLLGVQGAVLLPISAASQESLDARVKDLAEFDFEDASILDLAHTLGSRRTHLPKRGFMLAQRDTPIKDFLVNQVLQVISSPPISGDLQYAFVFTGQGAQWPEMCKELFAEFSVFRDAISEMDSILQSLPHPPSWTLRETILENSSTSLLHQASRSQPACTAIQVALVQLLETWDIHPSATLGHSSGEIAASFAAGYLSAAAAITIAYYRGYVVGKHVSDGAMMAAGVSDDKARSEISDAGYQGKINVACINSPESVTISGDSSEIDALLASFKTRGIFARKLNTGGQAYHSHHMKPLGLEYQKLLEQALPNLDMSYKLPTGPIMSSTVTGELQSSNVGPVYWRSNLESPVLFSHAVDRLSKEGNFHLVEIGPHSALELPIKQIRFKSNIASESMPYSAVIKRNANALESVLGFAGSLWLHGHVLSFDKINGLRSTVKSGRLAENYKVLHNLPTYKWHYDGELWNECRASVEFRHRKNPRHELLGSQIPGGDGINFTWRNILRVDDVSWLRDHKLDETIVFPGAGYLAMAIEAARQSSKPDSLENSSFCFKNVNILAALVLSAEPSASVELFTTICQSPITRASTSDVWWDFDISSFQGDVPVPHASGSISINTPSESQTTKYQAPADSLVSNVSRVWYENLGKQGLRFGPTFQSIEEFQVSRMKTLRHCSTVLPIMKTCGKHGDSYPIHPITLDAMFQTSIVASSAGNTADLRAKVPTQIGSAVIAVPKPSTSLGSINSVAHTVGFGVEKCGAELVDSSDNIISQFTDIRLAPYEAATQLDDSEKRHPMLRVLWKPDVYGLGLISSDRLSDYLDNFVRESRSGVKDEGLLKLGAALSLLAHKNSSLRILELGNEIHEITQAAIQLLGSNTSFKRFRSYTVGKIAENGELLAADVDLLSGERQTLSPVTDQTFDLVFLPLQSTSDSYLQDNLDVVRSIMTGEGLLLAHTASNALSDSVDLDTVSCPISLGSAQIIVSRAIDPTVDSSRVKDGNFVVVDQEPNPLSEAILKKLTSIFGRTFSRLAITEVTESSINPGSTVFCLAECEKPLLASISEEDLARVKHITNNAKDVIWVTRGNLLESPKPDFALVSGIARALVLEQPSVRFFVYDIDGHSSQVDNTAESLISVLRQGSTSLDKEFIQHRGVVHVSRYVPDDTLNDSFRQQQGTELVEIPLKHATPARLSIEKPGQFDSIFFKQMESAGNLHTNSVQLQTKAVGLNPADFDVLTGKADTINGTCALEYSGIVENVGSDVTSLKRGDRVVVMAPSHLQTTLLVPDWACQKMEDGEDFNTLAALPVAYATAIYALHDRGKVQRGETVLIHSGARAVGVAAIQIAALAGAEVFTTVSSDSQKDYLIRTCGVKPSNILSSLDSSFLPDILRLTDRRGVDVVLNSLAGDLLHASWRCCGSFGRFVEIGKRDMTSAGRLEMDQFLRNVTFTAFDLSHLYNTSNASLHAKWAPLLAEVLRLYRNKQITPVEPLEVFDVSNIAQGLRSFQSSSWVGKTTISFEDDSSLLRVQPSKYTSTFSSEKSYIMVGCLGGLGRSLSKWMMSRGARKFVYLGRSGIDKAPARQLIEDLERNGAECKVVRGDVCGGSAIDEVVNQAETEGPIGGVVQAAMGLNESLFTTMSNEYWHTGIDPKVVGTWNLHNAIKGKDSDLEFFLMTSSISGTVGTATESNYCSANNFLDHFARFRRASGLPATSVGLGMISEVGYLHENPEIEALLLRKGIQAINEDELLQIVDISLSSTTIIPHSHDELAHAHVLTGLEPFGLRELRKKGFEETNPALDDPRAAILAGALYGQDDIAFQNQDGNLPAEVVDLLEKGSSMSEAVLAHITKRFGNLILMPASQVDVAKPLAGYGMDSMIAAEFRTWFFQAFKVDIPFLTLLSKTSTVQSLSDTVVADVKASSE